MSDDRLNATVAELFAAFSRFFSVRWARMAEDPHARDAWAHALQMAALSPKDVRRGIALASQEKWPPASVGEFIELCRPDDAPSLQVALAEACAWARGDLRGAWSHAAIGAAALEVGSWSLRQNTSIENARAFGHAYRQAQARIRRGQSVDVPSLLALPAPGNLSRGEKATLTDKANQEISTICEMLGVRRTA